MSVINRGHWGSRLGFILAASGSAIGLGNIWKFPYITGVHGGGAFVLIYLICILLIGIPVMLAEFVIGRSTSQNPIGAFRKLEGDKTFWVLPGFMGVIAAFVILSYYSVVSGWVLDYTAKSLIGEFHQGRDTGEIKAMLGTLLGNGWLQVGLHFIFISFTTLIVMFGIKGGIEKASKILMPLLFIILLLLFLYSFTQPGNAEAWEFLFYPSFERLTPQGVLEGLGHAFFTLSLGMGAMITYGSYLKKDQKLIKSAFIIAALDTIIALMAGIVIFSIVFSFNLEPGAGPSLIFSTLPTLFAQMPGGSFISVAFFLLLLFAALTSAISICEVVVAYFVDTFSWQRKKVAFGVGVIAFFAGLLSAFSYNSLSEFKLPVAFIFGDNLVFFDTFDKLASNILLPLGGLLIAIFVGWKMKRDIIKAEFTKDEKKFIPILIFIVRYLAPVLIGIVFLYGLTCTHPLFKWLGLISG